MAVTWKKLCYEDDAGLKAALTAKGDILSASAAATPEILGVGTDGQVLLADSGETSGLKWGSLGSGDFMADGSVPMTADLDFAGFHAKDMAFQNVADEAARLALTPVLGKAVFQVDELAGYICTAVA